MKKSIILSLAGLCLFIYGALYLNIPLPSLRAAPNTEIDTGSVSPDSVVVIQDGSADINLYSPDGAFYQTKTSDMTGALEFMNKAEVEGDPLLPANFQKSVRLFRQNKTGNESHYFYQQTVNGIPVYASQLGLHQRSGNQIYSVQGNVVTDDAVLSGPLTEDAAKSIALNEAARLTTGALRVTAVNRLIFNGLAIGVDNDPNNYLSLVVSVESVNAGEGFARKYFISTYDGRVLFSEDLTRQALNRKVNNCNNTGNCAKSRYEGDAATGNADIDLAYDTLGSYYNFIKNNFNRDSYDGQGGIFLANINFYMNLFCPNAWSENSIIYICRGLVAKDVISHEVSHAMNHTGPSFVYANQSGAIDEALADIYATAIDSNWTLGETTQGGTVRSLQDPSVYGQPDKLFSSNYACESGEANDDGGVHTNGGILGKAFYLMVTGGTFNGCTITGIGKDKAYAITYKAEMSYMSASSNYKTVYNAFNQACADLYGSSSGDCIQVRNSLRAVQMDQQPEGTQKSPVCDNGQQRAPDCSTTAPTTPPTATTQPASPTPVPASTGTQPTATGAPSPTPSPVAASQTVPINLKLRLQGVFEKPSDAAAVPVKVRLVKNGQTVYDKSVTFNWMQTGTILGSFSVTQITPGDGYILYVKAPLHLERKICDTAPVEIMDGRYSCYGNTLTLGGANEIDATGILQPAGDIPDDSGKQDNIVNSFDLSLIRNNLGTRDAGMLKRLDLNYDGAVDSRDFDLANQSSSITLER